jgi:hypothetical protein
VLIKTMPAIVIRLYIGGQVMDIIRLHEPAEGEDLDDLRLQARAVEGSAYMSNSSNTHSALDKRSGYGDHQPASANNGREG